jgi:hypothetical protein
MARKKKIEVEQLSLFENPKGPTAQQFREELMREFRASKGEYLQEAKKKRKRNRGDSIFLPEDGRAYQDSFAVQPVYEYPEWCFPPVSTKPEGVRHILVEAIFDSAYKDVNGPVRIGLDFEFSPEKHKISIIGVANNTQAAACRWDDSFLPLLYAAIDDEVEFVVGLGEEVLSVFVGEDVFGDSFGPHDFVEVVHVLLGDLEADGVAGGDLDHDVHVLGSGQGGVELLAGHLGHEALREGSP